MDSIKNQDTNITTCGIVYHSPSIINSYKNRIQYDDNSAINQFIKNIFNKYSYNHETKMMIFEDNVDLQKYNYEQLETDTLTADEYFSIMNNIFNKTVPSFVEDQSDSIIQSFIVGSGYIGLNKQNMNINEYFKKWFNQTIMTDFIRDSFFINGILFEKINSDNKSYKCDNFNKLRNNILTKFEENRIHDEDNDIFYRIIACITQGNCAMIFTAIHTYMNSHIIKLMSHDIANPSFMFAERIFGKGKKYSTTHMLQITKFNVVLNWCLPFILLSLDDNHPIGNVDMFLSYNLINHEISVSYNINIDLSSFDIHNEFKTKYNINDKSFANIRSTNFVNFNTNINNIQPTKFQQLKETINENKKSTAIGTAVGLTLLSAIPMALLLGGKSKKNKYKNKYNRKLKKHYRTKRNKCMQNKSRCQNKKYKNSKKTRRK